MMNGESYAVSPLASMSVVQCGATNEHPPLKMDGRHWPCAVPNTCTVHLFTVVYVQLVLALHAKC